METTIFGPPGAGKTTKLLEIVDEALSNGVPPQKIGFLSFSKAAAEEAKQRACEKFGFEHDALPWFRTLHSLAFNTIGIRRDQIMDHKDYKKFEEFVGVPFSSYALAKNGSALLWVQKKWKEGDDYLNIIMKARCLRKTAFEVYNELPPEDAWKLNRHQLDLIEKAYPKFKKLHAKYDFVDLCEEFVEQGNSPEFDLLIIDEAQDLVPLQWEMLKDVMVPRSKRTYYAGDDDQAIYEWMGVDVNQFLSASEDKIVLDKSYRISKEALELAKKITSRISNRQQKEFTFKHEKGEVRFHRWMKQIDLNKGREEGEDWLILCRTNSHVLEVAEILKYRGDFFYIEGYGFSVNPDVLIASSIWLKLVKPGAEITWKELHDLTLRIKPSLTPGEGERQKMFARVGKSDRNKLYTFGDFMRKTRLTGKIHDKTHWASIIDVSDKEQLYLEQVRVRGEKVLNNTKPRIRLSTIHRAKGKEADNVLLFTRTSRVIREQQRRNPEAEDRVFYVGLTRARRDLHIMEEIDARKEGYRIA